VPTNAQTGGFAAVILTGGTGRRLGLVDKAGLTVGGRSLLTRALDAVQGAEPIVVVGPRPGSTTEIPAPAANLQFTREDPPGGGPAAGLLAGRDALPADVTLMVVLAVDMPGVTPATIGRLLAACPDTVDGAFLHASDGRRQLAGVIATTALDRVRPPAEATSGLPMHRLLDPLDLVEVAAVGTEGSDIDTWADLGQHTEP
jgi:molybdopterin-guanine dinucleotide biosynthesis protein A